MSAAGPDPYVPERGDDGYAVRRYDVDLAYAVSSNHLRGTARIEVRPRRRLAAFSLDLAGLRVSKVTVGGVAGRWRHRGSKLDITPPAPLAAGTDVAVEVRYSGNPSTTPSAWGPVGWEELADGAFVAAQPSGAPTWFPCNDLPSQKAPFSLAFTTDAPYTVVANGELVERRERGSATTWVYEQREPTSPYLLSVHVGRYATLALAERPVRVTLVAEQHDLRRAQSAFRRQVQMVEELVDLFGPYPLSAGYTVVVCPTDLEIPVEAQGQATFGTNHLDAAHERLVAHELAHQWFGNSVTAATWRDIWLHEGFCCYAEWLWSERSGGPAAGALAREAYSVLALLPQDLVLCDPGAARMFDDRVYKRGALALHAVRVALGDQRFFGLLREWAESHRHGVATTADFEALAGVRLAGWLHEPALPAFPA